MTTKSTPQSSCFLTILGQHYTNKTLLNLLLNSTHSEFITVSPPKSSQDPSSCRCRSCGSGWRRGCPRRDRWGQRRVAFHQTSHRNLGKDIHVYTNCHFFRYCSSGKPITTKLSEWRNLFQDIKVSIFPKIPSSAGSHFTEWSVSLVSHAAASCSLRCKDSEVNEHTKQCIVKWKFG